MIINRNASINRLMARRSAKNVQNELLKSYSNNILKSNKSEFRRTVSESGVRIELSQKAKEMLRDKYIDEVLESGEPLRGISYEDYFWYYKNKRGYINESEVRQEYKQALKGDNASLNEKEWRTDPNYIIPQRLWDNPVVAEDRNAAIEKIRNGEELEDWENKIAMTFSNGFEGSRVLREARIEQRTHSLEKTIADSLASLDIELGQDKELRFEVWGDEMKIFGDLDDEKLNRIYELLKSKSGSLCGSYDDHHPLSKSDDAEWWHLQNAESYLRDTGVSVFDISLDKNGEIVGLPDDISDFISEYADKPLYVKTKSGQDIINHSVEKALNMRNTFISAIQTIGRGKYNYFRSRVARLTYKNGILSC